MLANLFAKSILFAMAITMVVVLAEKLYGLAIPQYGFSDIALVMLLAICLAMATVDYGD